MSTVGLVVNPLAGRDSRRVVGSAVVSDAYAKQRSALAVLQGATAVETPPNFLVMPDDRGLAERVVGDAPAAIRAELLDIPITGTRADTRAAATAMDDRADVIVALGGDGTVRDVAAGCTDTPIAAVSTGTNNVVPTAIDGTAAGVAAALLATERIDVEAVTERHRTVAGEIATGDDVRAIEGVASIGIVDRPFTGTGAILRGNDLIGGVVSRASPGASGIVGIAGALGYLSPWSDDGRGLRFADPERAPRTATAITVPGVVERIGIAESRRLEPGEDVAFDLTDGVVSADGEREREVTAGQVRLWIETDGPTLVDFEGVFERAANDGSLVR